MRDGFYYRSQLRIAVCFMLLLNACASTSDAPAQSMAGTTSSASLASADGLTGDNSNERVAEASIDADPIICERIAEIGTKIQKKTCMRKSQWDRQKSASSEMTSEWQRKGNLVGNPSGE